MDTSRHCISRNAVQCAPTTDVVSHETFLKNNQLFLEDVVLLDTFCSLESLSIFSAFSNKHTALGTHRRGDLVSPSCRRSPRSAQNVARCCFLETVMVTLLAQRCLHQLACSLLQRLQVMICGKPRLGSASRRFSCGFGRVKYVACLSSSMPLVSFWYQAISSDAFNIRLESHVVDSLLKSFGIITCDNSDG